MRAIVEMLPVSFHLSSPCSIPFHHSKKCPESMLRNPYRLNSRPPLQHKRGREKKHQKNPEKNPSPPQKKNIPSPNHLEKTVQKAKAPLISMISSCDFNSASTSQRAAMTSSSGGAGSSGAGSGTGGISRSIRDLVTCQAVVAEVSRSGCYRYQMYIVDI